MKHSDPKDETKRRDGASAEPAKIIVLAPTQLGHVAGGLNPQPLPPRGDPV